MQFSEFYLIIVDTIGFLDPENVGLAVKINVLAYLEVKILQNLNFRCLYGGHFGMSKMAAI